MPRSILSIEVILIIVLLTLTPLSFGHKIKTSDLIKQPSISTNNNILYVGGSGPGNYSTIQDAINNSLNGDTIYVYSGTYPENISINKSINLIGENRKNTIIKVIGYHKNNIVTVTANQVNISNFTIIGNLYWTGVYLISSNNTIQYMDILDNTIGIFLSNTSHNNFINNNYLYENGIKLEGACNNTLQENHMRRGGITLSYQSNYNIVTKNTFIESYGAVNIKENSYYNIVVDNYITGMVWESIQIWKKSKYNQVLNNTIYNCHDGLIRIQQSDYNNIIGNHLTYNTEGGVLILLSSGCNVSHNCLYNNGGGIRVCQNSRKNTIYRNVIEDICGDGLSLRSGFEHITSNNSIVENTVSNCTVGMYLFNTIDNEIYRNNFINNKNEIICELNCNNIWDDSSLGNYWEDYIGCDRDGDGIGDQPKSIEGDNNSDHCPLMVPYGSDTAIRITTPLGGYIYLRNIRLIPFSSTIVFGNIKIKASAANYKNNEIEIEKVEFYVDGRLRWIDKRVPYSWRWRLSSHIKHNHTISVIVYDSSGYTAVDEQQVWRFF